MRKLREASARHEQTGNLFSNYKKGNKQSHVNSYSCKELTTASTRRQPGEGFHQPTAGLLHHQLTPILESWLPWWWWNTVTRSTLGKKRFTLYISSHCPLKEAKAETQTRWELEGHEEVQLPGLLLLIGCSALFPYSSKDHKPKCSITHSQMGHLPLITKETSQMSVILWMNQAPQPNLIEAFT